MKFDVFGDTEPAELLAEEWVGGGCSLFVEVACTRVL